jgi:ABC-2 type transport system permease protein
MNAFMTHFSFEFKTGLRNPTLMLMNYLFPLAFYAMMGLVMVQINPGFKEVIIPAMIIFVAMVSSLLGLPGPLVEAREAGVFRSFKINGVPALSILAVPALTTIFHTLIAAVIITTTAGPFFGGALPTSWLNFVLVSLLVVFSLGAMGMLIGVVAEGSRSVTLLGQAIFLPAMLLGGLMMPLEFIPEGARSVSALLPPAHAMQAFLSLAYGQETIIAPVVSLAALTAGGLLSLGLAIYLFNWDQRNTSRKGHPLMGVIALLPYIIAALVYTRF